MNKVTTINLNGRAYQLEERGFEALRKYLETAAAKLDGNPDKDEIMADFEQAIADKCDQKLSPAPGKNVITEREIDDIIAAMGPVEGENSHSSSTDSGDNSATGAPKRLYRIPAGEWIIGVCNGLAAYFNIDVTLVRIVFILLTLISHGLGILAYIVLAIVMPPARTDEQFAKAHGWTSRPPLNANDFIEQTKKRYAEWRVELEKMHDAHKAKMAAEHGWTKEDTSKIKEDVHKWKHDFKKEMREKKQQMKQEWRAQQRQWHQDRYQSRREDMGSNGGPGREYTAPQYSRSYGISRAIFGFFAVIVSIVLLAIAVTWVLTLYTLIKYGTVFGYALGAGHPLWVSIVFLAAAFYITSIPFRLLIHHAWDYEDRHSGWSEFGRTLVFLAMCAVLIWSARELFPQVNTWWNVGVEWVKMKI